jgi:protein-tyrosine phosphatase
MVPGELPGAKVPPLRIVVAPTVPVPASVAPAFTVTAELAIEPHPFAKPAESADQPIYLHLPFEDTTDTHATALMSSASSMPALYGVMLDRFAQRVAGIVEAIAATPAGGVLIHCHAGKDRTGMVAALLLRPACGQVIAEDYALSDLNLRPSTEAPAE